MSLANVSEANITKIVLHTGNVLDNEELVRKVGQTTLEEIRGCVKSTLNVWKKESKVECGVLEVRGEKGSRTTLQETSPKELKTTVKIFLSNTEGRSVKDAINTVKKELNAKVLYSVIVIPPDVSEDLSLNGLKSIWNAMEAAVDLGIVRSIGIADLSTPLFQELYSWARIKPTTIQISLSSCCTVSDELHAYAKSNDVQILIHSDEAEILDEDLVASILSRVGMTGVQCEVLWIARHRSIQTCYGLLKDKGYTLALSVGN